MIRGRVLQRCVGLTSAGGCGGGCGQGEQEEGCHYIRVVEEAGGLAGLEAGLVDLFHRVVTGTGVHGGLALPVFAQGAFVFPEVLGGGLGGVGDGDGYEGSQEGAPPGSAASEQLVQQGGSDQGEDGADGGVDGQALVGGVREGQERGEGKDRGGDLQAAEVPGSSGEDDPGGCGGYARCGQQVRQVDDRGAGVPPRLGRGEGALKRRPPRGPGRAAARRMR